MAKKRQSDPTVETIYAALEAHPDDIPALLEHLAALGYDTDSLSINLDKQGSPVEVWPEEGPL